MTKQTLLFLTIGLALVGLNVIGCRSQEPTLTSLPPTTTQTSIQPTDIPPTATLTSTPQPPTATPTPTNTPTNTPTTQPTNTPTSTPTPSKTPLPFATTESVVLTDDNVTQDFYDLTWSPNGDWLAVAHSAGGFVYDANLFVEQFAFETDGFIRGLRWSADSQLLLAAGAGGVYIWGANIGEAVLVSEVFSWDVTAAPDFTFFAATSGAAQDGLIGVISDDGEVLHVLDGHSGADVLTIALSPDRTRIASGGNDNTVVIWDVTSGKEMLRLEPPKDGISFVASVDWSPDGTILASGGSTLTLWDAASGHPIQELGSQSATGTAMQSVSWSPDGTLLATGGQDGNIYLWEVDSGELLYVFNGHSGIVWGIAWSPDGTQVGSASDDGKVQIWTLPSTP